MNRPPPFVPRPGRLGKPPPAQGSVPAPGEMPTGVEAALLRTLGDHERRIKALEQQNPMREELQSRHDWDELLTKAGQELSKRVKDPRDQLDSNRARAIAQEVVQGAHIADDAKAFRVWRSRGAFILVEAIKWVSAGGGGAVLYHLWKGGR